MKSIRCSSLFLGALANGGLPATDKKAIVNVATSRVLGIVSRDYRLVTNKQALEWAYECCVTVFPQTKPAEWDVSTTDAPSTAGHCRIDLAHRTAALDFGDVRPGKRPDAFGPFIRVTNSYNGLRALSFDIGFYRKVCRNGLIAPETLVQFRFAHGRRDLGAGIRFDVARERLEKLQRKLDDTLSAIKECAVSRMAFETIVQSVMLIRQPLSLQPGSREADDWQKLNHHVGALCDRYAGELGETAYAVLNVITDFASHPPDNRHIHRDRHGLQRLAGTWLTGFGEQCRQPDFTVERYLAALTTGPEGAAARA